MAKAKKQARPQYMDYPKHQAYRGGCKVAWNYYTSKADADLCAVAARHNAILQRNEGFDFGYCEPGSIRHCTQAGEYHGMYEVCLP